MSDLPQSWSLAGKTAAVTRSARGTVLQSREAMKVMADGGWTAQ